MEALDKFEKAIDRCTNDFKNKYALFWWKADALKAMGHDNEAKLFYNFALDIAPQEQIELIKKQMQ